MKVIVTGGSGLVGFSLQKMIQSNQETQESNQEHNNEYIFLSSKDCNLLDYNQTLNKFQEIKPNIVVHLAANVGGLFKNMNNNTKMFTDNLLINYNVLEVCKNIGVELVLSCLSSCIFPNKVNYPITEDQLNNGAPHYSNSGYAYGKRFIDTYTQLLNYDENVSTFFVNLIPTNIYGENDNYNLEDSHVIPALIHNAYLSVQNNEKFVVKGSGNALRMFIHSDDFAKVILDFVDFYLIDNLNRMKQDFKITREKQNNYNFIVSGSDTEEVSIKYIAEKIAEYSNITNNDIIFDTSFADGQYRKPVCNSLLKNLYYIYGRDLVFENFDKKIQETVNYFRENYDKIRK